MVVQSLLASFVCLDSMFGAFRDMDFGSDEFGGLCRKHDRGLDTRAGQVFLRGALVSDAEGPLDEALLPGHIARRQPPDLTIADDVMASYPAMVLSAPAADRNPWLVA